MEHMHHNFTEFIQNIEYGTINGVHFVSLLFGGLLKNIL